MAGFLDDANQGQEMEVDGGQEDEERNGTPSQPPPLPEDFHMEPSRYSLTDQDRSHVNQNLSITLDEARIIEQKTRERGNRGKIKKLRISSDYFRQVCYYRNNDTAKKQAERIFRPVYSDKVWKALEMRPKAIKQYTELYNTKHWQCGVVIHPDAPWLCSSPNGVVYDQQTQTFGLLVVKCTKESYRECEYLEKRSDQYKLKTSHKHYWEVQGHLLITGMKWCDFLVYSEKAEIPFKQRIRKDLEVFRTILERGSEFYFKFYLPLLRENGIVTVTDNITQ